MISTASPAWWKAAGRIPPDDVEELKARIAILEQEKADLRLQLNECTEELGVARALGREPTKTINQSR
jgi:uncharacterized small protein (DUF1192 family)